MSIESYFYRIPGALWSLEFPVSTIEKFQPYVQTNFLKRESVGQLYSACLTSTVVRIDEATKLKSKWATFRGVSFDSLAAQLEREEKFENGLHCLGYWHTHPERVPMPSQADVDMMAEHALASKDMFSGIIFVIVGSSPAPEGLRIWFHDGVNLWEFLEVKIQ